MTNWIHTVIAMTSMLSMAIPDVKIWGMRSLRGYGRCGRSKDVPSCKRLFSDVRWTVWHGPLLKNVDILRCLVWGFGLGIGGWKFYLHVPRMALPIRLFRHFCCSMSFSQNTQHHRRTDRQTDRRHCHASSRSHWVQYARSRRKMNSQCFLNRVRFSPQHNRWFVK